MRAALVAALVAAVLAAASAPAAAQSLTLARQTVGDVAFETRVDTSAVDCREDAPRRLGEGDTDAPPCGSGRWLVLTHRGVALDSLEAPMAWLGFEPDSVASEALAGGPPWPVAPPVPRGAVRDLTGDGVPEVVLTAYSGGMHCCATHWVVSLAPEAPTVAARIDAADGLARVVETPDGPAVELADWTFAYWRTSFAESPAPRVVLRWDGHAFAPAADPMRASPVPDDLDALAAEVRAHSGWAEGRPPVAYWATLLDLLYAGRGAAADRFAHDAWPGDALGRAVFLSAFADQFWRSPFAPGVADMNPDVAWL